MSEESVVLVGKKPVMKYITACVAFFNAGSNTVVLRARGRAISRAVDIAELLRRAFVKNLQVKQVRLGTEEVEDPEGRKSYVSTIEIVLTRPSRIQELKVAS